MPLNAHAVHATLRRLLRAGALIQYTRHAQMRMRMRGFTEADVLEILHAGRCDESCTEVNAWGQVTYRIATRTDYVVIAFETDPEEMMIVITVV